MRSREGFGGSPLVFFTSPSFFVSFFSHRIPLTILQWIEWAVVIDLSRAEPLCKSSSCVVRRNPSLTSVHLCRLSSLLSPPPSLTLCRLLLRVFLRRSPFPLSLFWCVFVDVHASIFLLCSLLPFYASLFLVRPPSPFCFTASPRLAMIALSSAWR